MAAGRDSISGDTVFFGGTLQCPRESSCCTHPVSLGVHLQHPGGGSSARRASALAQAALAFALAFATLAFALAFALAVNLAGLDPQKRFWG